MCADGKLRSYLCSLEWCLCVCVFCLVSLLLFDCAASAPLLLFKALHHLPALWLVERNAALWLAERMERGDRGVVNSLLEELQRFTYQYVLNTVQGIVLIIFRFIFKNISEMQRFIFYNIFHSFITIFHQVIFYPLRLNRCVLNKTPDATNFLNPFYLESPAVGKHRRKVLQRPFKGSPKYLLYTST